MLGPFLKCNTRVKLLNNNNLMLQVDIGTGIKPPGYYIQRSSGLFPAPRPQDSQSIDYVEKLFEFMGIFFAKCIQDNRIVDIPLSRPFLKLMCMGDVIDNVSQNYRELLTRRNSDDALESHVDDDLTPVQEEPKEICPETAKCTASGSPWFSGLLNQSDFELVDPHRAKFLLQLQDLSERKQFILSNNLLSEAEKRMAIEELTLENPPVKLEDLWYVT